MRNMINTFKKFNVIKLNELSLFIFKI